MMTARTKTYFNNNLLIFLATEMNDDFFSTPVFKFPLLTRRILYRIIKCCFYLYQTYIPVNSA